MREEVLPYKVTITNLPGGGIGTAPSARDPFPDYIGDGGTTIAPCEASEKENI